jgi:hypothetical protein
MTKVSPAVLISSKRSLLFAQYIIVVINEGSLGRIFKAAKRDLLVYARRGRWMSPDPAGVGAASPQAPQTWNRYAYVANNPLSAVDPTGLLMLSVCIEGISCWTVDSDALGDAGISVDFAGDGSVSGWTVNSPVNFVDQNGNATTIDSSTNLSIDVPNVPMNDSSVTVTENSIGGATYLPSNDPDPTLLAAGQLSPTAIQSTTGTPQTAPPPPTPKSPQQPQPHDFTHPSKKECKTIRGDTSVWASVALVYWRGSATNPYAGAFALAAATGGLVEAAYADLFCH